MTSLCGGLAAQRKGGVMVGDKVEHFQGKGTDLSALQSHIEQYLKADDFTVRVGIGKWLEHLAVAAVETLLISDLFLVVDVAETAWNFEIEDKLVKDFTSFIG
jgi:hypothetical protein